jgi:hypothetical protein
MSILLWCVLVEKFGLQTKIKKGRPLFQETARELTYPVFFR